VGNTNFLGDDEGGAKVIVSRGRAVTKSGIECGIEVGQSELGVIYDRGSSTNGAFPGRVSLLIKYSIFNVQNFNPREL